MFIYFQVMEWIKETIKFVNNVIMSSYMWILSLLEKTVNVLVADD